MNAEIDITGITLETQRLYIRPWRVTDIDDFYEYASVDGVGQMAGWEPHNNKEKSAFILDIFMKEKKTFAIELKDNRKVIGSIGIEKYDTKKFCGEFDEKQGRELGYVLSKTYWGMGLMPEAVKRIISYCFDELSLDFLTVGHFKGNEQSKRVIEKCGFQFYCEGEFKTRIGTIEKDCSYVLLNNSNITDE